MSRNRLYTILFSLLMAFLFMPIIQEHLGIFNIKPLTGVIHKTERPELTYQNYSEGKYQAQLERYTSENYGFREFTIRLYNQYLWTCFKKFNNRNVVLGKDKWLYDRINVEEYCQNLSDAKTDKMLSDLERQTMHFYKLQKILKDYGVNLFFNILPSKTDLYPEHLSEQYKKTDCFRAINYLPNRFDELGVDYLNLHEHFMNIKDCVDFNLFSRTGLHWSSISASYVSDTLTRYMEDLSGMNIHNVRMGEMYHDKPKNADNDLENMLNLIFPTKPSDNYYIDLDVIPDSTAVKPNFVVIGDSYFWNLKYVIPLNEVFNYCHYWYYFREIYFDPKHRNTKDIDLVTQMLDSDIIMVSLSVRQLYNIDMNYLSEALVQICYDDEYIDEKRNKIIESIKSSSKWMENIKDKAKKRGLAIDKVIWSEANYMLYTFPERYFEELKGDGIPTCRNSRIKEIYNNSLKSKIAKN